MKNAMAILIYMICTIIPAIGQYMRPADGALFDSEITPRIDIFIAQDSLDMMLSQDQLYSNHEYPATCIIELNGEVDTLENIGFRLRGNTSRISAKKSFKISINAFEPGQKYKGLEKINLNGEHNDPTITRADMVWDLFADMKVPAARSNHVRLYINSEFRGIYLHVEHIDEEFIQERFDQADGNLYKCLYPADLDYLGSNPDDYKVETSGRRIYDLKTNRDEDDYTRLVEMIQKLNLTISQGFQCQIEDILDVDHVIKAMVVDVMTSNWDGVINKNNFYLYDDPKTGKFVLIPYDVDNTLGIDWFGIDWAHINIYDYFTDFGGYRPLYQKMLELPEYRARFNFYLEQFIQQYYTLDRWEPVLTQRRSQLIPFRIFDSYAASDYGWNLQDFIDSYETGLGSHVPYGLFDFITERRDAALAQLEAYNTRPILTSHQVYHTSESFEVAIGMIDDGTISEVSIHYSIDGGDWAAEPMIWSAASYTWSRDITEEMHIEYYIRATDDTDQSRHYPFCHSYETQLGYEATPSLVINELMASNDQTIADEYGEYDDWIELYNADTESITLSRYYLTDDRDQPHKWRLPEVTLAPGAYYLIWADKDGHQGESHASFKLSASGEFLGLFDGIDNNSAPIDTIEFPAIDSDVSYGRSPNGIGEFEVLDFHSPNANNDINTAANHVREEDLSIYPNPVSNTLYYSVDGIDIQRAYSIINVYGQRVDDGYTNGRIDIYGLPAGVYILQLNIDSRNLSTSFVVE